MIEQLNSRIRPILDVYEELKHTSIREIPKSWEIIDLKDFIKFQEGPGIRNWQYVENGTKFVNIRCIQGNDLNLENANMISNEEKQLSKGRNYEQYK